MKKPLLLAISIFTISFAVIGCTNQSEMPDAAKSEASKIPQNEQTVEMKVVTDVKGSVEIPMNPKCIVDISGASDILSILGYELAGTANSDGYDYTKFPSYLEDILGNAEILGYSMLAEMDVEAIISLEPDLIILSTVQEKMYDQLSKIAPVVMLEMKQVDWEDDFMHVASVFGKEEIAEQWIDAYLERAEEVGDRIKEKYGKESSYLAFLASGGSLFIFDEAGLGSIFYDDMDLEKPDRMPEQENISLPVVTFEGLAQMDPDYIFAVAAEQDLETLTSSSIWNGLRAVKAGNVVTLPASPYFNQGYSPIGRMAFIEEVESFLERMHE